MSDKPLLLKPEPIQYVTVKDDVQFTQETHDKIQAYLDWNYSLNADSDFNYFLGSAVEYFLENDKAFAKYLKQKTRPSRRKKPAIKHEPTQANQETINQNNDHYVEA